jgi:hypothetical protein
VDYSVQPATHDERQAGHNITVNAAITTKNGIALSAGDAGTVPVAGATIDINAARNFTGFPFVCTSYVDHLDGQ